MRPYRLTDGAEARDYQLRGSHKIFTGTQGDGTATIIDMGLGKTFMVLHAIAEMFNWFVIQRPVIVVAPILVCETVWRQEAALWNTTSFLQFSLIRGTPAQRRFALHRQAHVYLINPELLDWLYTELRGNWDRFDVLVVDESSVFKSHSGKRFKVLTGYGDRHTVKGPDGKSLIGLDGKPIMKGGHKFKRTVIMTGTPAPTSLLNLWTQMYIVDHGKRLHAKFETYKDRYFYKEAQVADHVYKYGISDEEFETRPDWMPKDGAPVKIHEMIADATIELNGEDYGVLPKTIGDASKGEVPPTHLHYIDLPPAVRVLYDQMEKEALIELGKDSIMAANGGAKTMLCWQMANGFIYRTDDFGYQHTEQLHDLKLDKLVELIHRIGSNVIVTYYFKADRERIQQRLQREHIPFTGLTSKNASRVVEDWNKGRIPVLLLHPQSAGHGINLQSGGHNFIHYSQIWSLERYLQTNARLARSGQSQIVGFHHIAARDTVDDLMLLSHKERGDNQSRFRSALRTYQELRGWGIGNDPLLVPALSLNGVNSLSPSNLLRFESTDLSPSMNSKLLDVL